MPLGLQSGGHSGQQSGGQVGSSQQLNWALASACSVWLWETDPFKVAAFKLQRAHPPRPKRAAAMIKQQIQIVPGFIATSFETRDTVTG